MPSLSWSQVCLLLVVLSRSFGRAQTLGSYRPELPPPALSNGCYPLPPGVTFGFPFQVRTDGDVSTPHGERRALLMQFDVISVDAARAQVWAAFIAAGFSERPAPDADGLAFHRAPDGVVTAEFAALADVPEDSIVRGTIALNLPVVPAASTAPVCDETYSTKRFPAEAEAR